MRGKSAGGDSPYGGMGGAGPMPLVDLFRKQRPPTAFELIQENVNTAYSCAMLNSNLVAKTGASGLRLYLQTRRGESRSKISKRGDSGQVSRKCLAHLKRSRGAQMNKAIEVEEVFDHPILDLLNNPNPDSEDGVGISLYQLLDLTQLYLEVVGRCYWYTPRDGFGDRPSAIWILAAQHVREIIDRSSNNVIDRYTFGAGDRIQDYQPSEIIPFRFPDLTNPYVGGISPMRAVFEKTRLNRKVDAKSNALLSNGGLPAAMFVPSGSDVSGGVMDKQMRKRMQAQLQAKMALQQGGVMVAERAGQLVTLEWPTRDIADFETLQNSKIDICNGYQVPSGLLDPAEQSLAAMTTARAMHAENAGEPRCKRLEAALNKFYVSQWDKTGRLFLAFDSPLPDNQQESREDSKVLIAGRAIKVNELRQRHNMDPLDGPEGEEMVKPGNTKDESAPEPNPKKKPK